MANISPDLTRHSVTLLDRLSVAPSTLPSSQGAAPRKARTKPEFRCFFAHGEASSGYKYTDLLLTGLRFRMASGQILPRSPANGEWLVWSKKQTFGGEGANDRNRSRAVL